MVGQIPALQELMITKFLTAHAILNALMKNAVLLLHILLKQTKIKIIKHKKMWSKPGLPKLVPLDSNPLTKIFLLSIVTQGKKQLTIKEAINKTGT